MEIKVTKGEAAAIEWALYPMVDHWCTASGAHERDGPIYPESVLPVLEGCVLTLSDNQDINSDLYFRVCDQFPMVAEWESKSIQNAAARVADSIAAKLLQAGVKKIF